MVTSTGDVTIRGSMELISDYYTEPYYTLQGVYYPPLLAGSWVQPVVSGVTFFSFFTESVGSSSTTVLSCAVEVNQDSWNTLTYQNWIGNTYTLSSNTASNFIRGNGNTSWVFSGTGISWNYLGNLVFTFS